MHGIYENDIDVGTLLEPSMPLLLGFRVVRGHVFWFASMGSGSISRCLTFSTLLHLSLHSLLTMATFANSLIRIATT